MRLVSECMPSDYHSQLEALHTTRLSGCNQERHDWRSGPSLCEQRFLHSGGKFLFFCCVSFTLSTTLKEQASKLCDKQVVHGTLHDQDVGAVLLRTSIMLTLASPTGCNYAEALGKPYTAMKKAMLKKWRSTFPAGSVLLFDQFDTQTAKLFCISTPHS